MAKSWAEYKREFRQRQREERRDKAALVRPYFREPFFEYFDEHAGFDLNWYAAVLGNEWSTFENDSGLNPEEGALIQEDIDRVPDSLAKAEFLIDHFMDLTANLVRTVNEYKRQEVNTRLSEIERLDPSKRKKAAPDAAKLRKMRDQLDTRARYVFPQWRVTGE
ncbi:hypothetical protein [Agrobacterium pusense]|uniref:hypothetical protein n=1 Tax=Agrobacterium pusense TaxID=648995 RepID=UPI0022C2AD95|nr:hypothetical protein [Agrobacterium salinitolerans]